MSDDVKHEFVRYTRGYGLDLSAGPTLPFPHFLGVRESTDPAAKPPHIVVDSFADLGVVDDNKCDFIVHAGNGKLYVDEWMRCLKPGGYLCLFAPKMSADELQNTVAAGCTMAQSRIRRGERSGGFLVLRKGGWPEEVRHEKSACVVRHGGIGDQMQAAYLMPELKRQGYHITMLTTDKGRNLLEHDPHIDEWYMIDHGQIPNVELGTFWRVTASRYDKFINMNESVEGTFLAIPGRPQHIWPHRLRHKMLNKNYAEFAADLSEIPFVPEGQFYPTNDEIAAAMGRLVEARSPLAPALTKAEPVFVIMWSLAGSSPHKFTPHQDTVLRIIMGTLKRAVVIMVGDDACKILEAGWENEARITKLSGELQIRDTLTLAQQVDLVIGPETGVLNAVCYHEVPKVVMLSHSSHENLTKHWKNVYPIPGVAPCAPCHQLHYSNEFCPQDKTLGGAVCQSGVDPMALFQPIAEVYEGWARVHMMRAA